MNLPRQESITIEDVDEVIRGQQPGQSDEMCKSKLSSAIPRIVILEQPASRSIRFRYECEGRSAGSIPGVNSTSTNKTYPTIQIQNYSGSAVVVVSCVTKDPPYRAHPNNLVGKEGCRQGVCTVIINNSDMTYSFTSLGIQCVKKKNIEESLKLRENIKVDPFLTGFSHSSIINDLDLSSVRLCFQAFIKGPDDKYTVSLTPVVSDIIYDKKAMSDLSIYKLSHYSAPVSGGTEVIMLCDKIVKNDIQIRFFEEKNEEVVWEGWAEFQPCDVYRLVAICFRTPRYHDESVKYPVNVNVQLVRPSNNEKSLPRPFQLLPLEPDPEGLVRKRLKIEGGCLHRFYMSSNEKTDTEEVIETKPVIVPRMIKHAIRNRPKTSGADEVGSSECGSAMYVQRDHSNPVCTTSSSIDSGINLPTASGGSSSKNESFIVNSTQDFLAIATQCLGEVPTTFDHLTTEGNILEATEKIDSLDLGIDPVELLNLDPSIGENMSINLSSSLFDSENQLELPLNMDNVMQQKE
ncbi:embryonic polarity protein dorsal-like [Centruroides sculpturatus]|uniref:embryonic polarity protein dorsal-like n=1 Tax=Centruroides sculpturatus TaxID=218467 RepID=UPI000C6DE410|nr:embryonic polarity protein dorsal-like [Centruroides sculpturatus]